MSCFQAFTGLKVNVRKSEIVPVREVNNLVELASILQCRVGSFPINIWECRWEFLLRQLRFGILFWRRWKKNFQGGSVSIYLRVVGSHY